MPGPGPVWFGPIGGLRRGRRPGKAERLRWKTGRPAFHQVIGEFARGFREWVLDPVTPACTWLGARYFMFPEFGPSHIYMARSTGGPPQAPGAGGEAAAGARNGAADAAVPSAPQARHCSVEARHHRWRQSASRRASRACCGGIIGPQPSRL